MRPTPAPIRCVLGVRGHGKSTVARQLVRDRRRLLVYDTRREHEALPLSFTDFERYVDAVAADGFSRPFRVAMTDIGFEEDFCAIAWTVGERLTALRGHDARGTELTVFLDEADQVAQPGREMPIFKRLASQGRHNGIELVACARRPVELSRLLTANADDLVLCRTQEPDDVRYLRSIIGDDAGAAVSELPRFECVRWSQERWGRFRISPSGDLTPTGEGSVTASRDSDFPLTPPAGSDFVDP